MCYKSCDLVSPRAPASAYTALHLQFAELKRIAGAKGNRVNIFKLSCDEQGSVAPSTRRRRCECYGCRLAAERGDNAQFPRELTGAEQRAADLNTRLLQIIPESEDAEQMVDEFLGLALGAFDAREITEDQFRDLSAKCLDTLTFLAR